MPRTKRVVVVGVPHHVTVFLNDNLFRTYLELLDKHAAKNHLRVLAYCLMTNHVHLVVVPETERSLANTFRHALGRFAQYWNTEFHRSGHLWQNRFYSCPVEESRVWRVIQYVEQNPVRAGMIETAAAYPWSSAPAHVGAGASPVLDCNWWSQQWTVESWASVLNDADDATAIRLATYSGRPYGSGPFVQALEAKLGRQLEHSNGGRPRKEIRETTQMQLWRAE